MPDLTPPPMSGDNIDTMIADHVDPVATYPKLCAFARAIEAHVNEQWRQRLEAVAVVGDLVLTVRERAMGSGALNRDNLYRIKEQG